MCEAVEKLANSRAEKVRIEIISKFLSKGGSESDAKNLLEASSEELEEAKTLMLQTV